MLSSDPIVVMYKIYYYFCTIKIVDLLFKWWLPKVSNVTIYLFYMYTKQALN